nr:flavonoid O-methyltransferase 6 [Scutellaria baicalensis]
MALPKALANSSTEEILEAQSHVWNHILSFINSMSLKCALELGIPDIIHKHGKPMSVSELVEAIPTNKAKSNELNLLMRLLTHSKFFDMSVMNDDEEAYSLTRASYLLLRDEPLTLVHLTLLSLDPIMMDPGHYMSEWFKNEDLTSFVTQQGMPFWQYAKGDERLNELFNKSMSGDGVSLNVLVRDCRQVFEGLSSMVDVGGGNGVTARSISDTFPGLKCTVLDLPQAVAGLEGSENVSFVSGDMFHFIPHADAILFKNVFHNWEDEECVKVLRNCKEALGRGEKSGGKVIIIDMVVNDKRKDDQGTETQLCLGLMMMYLFRGKERTEKEWAKLFFDSGFRSYKIHPVLGLRSVIEVFP